MGFSTADLIVLILYLAAVTWFGLKVSGKQQHAEDYFLAGDGLPWWAVLFSVVATETSTLTFISIPAVAYAGNLSFLQITFGYALGRVIVALFFLPRYFEGKLKTAYQFLEQRFGSGMKNATSITFLFTRLLADGVRLFATAIPLALLLRFGGLFSGWDDISVYLLSIGIITAVTLIYTYFGGIRAVVWMDVVQLAVYLGGALLALGILIHRLPDNTALLNDPEIWSQKTRLIVWGSGETIRDFLAAPYTFFTAIIGGAVFTLASHGTDQLLVQRVLAAGDLRSGQKALIGSGIMVVFQFALFLVIGLLLFAFYGGSDAEAMGLATTDEIFVRFIMEELPSGVSGLIVAALFAAAMSSLSSSLNSLASSTTYDLYLPYFGKGRDSAVQLRISRVITLVWGVVLSLAAVYFTTLQLQSGERPAVVELGLGIASYTYGGLLGAFLLGLFFPRVQKKAALIGFFTGMTSLLFMVKGPVQQLLPGEGLALAWPLYTLAGSVIVVVTGVVFSNIVREES